MKKLLKVIAQLLAILIILIAWLQIENRLWLKLTITVVLFLVWMGYELYNTPVQHEHDWDKYLNEDK